MRGATRNTNHTTRFALLREADTFRLRLRRTYCTIRTFVDGRVGGEEEMDFGQHGHDLAVLVSAVPPDLVEGRLVLWFGNVGIDLVAPGL